MFGQIVVRTAREHVRMPHAKLTVTLPEGTWIRAVSESHPEVRFRVLSALPAEGGRGVGLLELDGPAEPVERVLDAMRAREGIDSLDIMQAGDGEALVRFETSQPLLLLAARESGVPLDLPIDIRDGEVVLEMVTPHERLSELGEQFDALGLRYTVEHVRQLSESADLLSERQRDLLETAVELGYYDTPRECTLTELADELGIAKSTASERLHRVEGAVVKAHLAENSAPTTAENAETVETAEADDG